MSQTVLFEIGAVIFVFVSAVVFLYGLTWFSDWQRRDDDGAEAAAYDELADRDIQGDDGMSAPVDAKNPSAPCS